MRPSSMARTIDVKLSSTRIMLAASFETSVPLMPIAIPMSARLRAGASFTPSPVTATISPISLRASVILSLCCGLTRAKMISRSLSMRSFISFVLEILFRSFPVMISKFFVVRRPTCSAIACAVKPLSPVTIYVLMPASLVRAIASLTSRRGGSIIPTSPTNVRLFSVAASV